MTAQEKVTIETILAGVGLESVQVEANNKKNQTKPMTKHAFRTTKKRKLR